MKTHAMTALLLALFFSSCRKEDDFQTEHDFKRALAKDYLIKYPWSLDRKDEAHKAANAKTIALAGKSNVLLWFNEWGAYGFSYDSIVPGGSDTLHMSEGGEYLADADGRTIHFHPDATYDYSSHVQLQRSDYTYSTPFLRKHELHLVHSYTTVQTVINNEGVPVQQNNTAAETLYFIYDSKKDD